MRKVSQYTNVSFVCCVTPALFCANLKPTPSALAASRDEWPRNKPRVAVTWLVSLCASLSYRTKTLQTALVDGANCKQFAKLRWGLSYFSYTICSILGHRETQSTNHQTLKTTYHQPSNNSSPHRCEPFPMAGCQVYNHNCLEGQGHPSEKYEFVNWDD